VVNEIPKNSINYTTFNFDDPPEQTAFPSNVKKDKFVSHLFRENSQESANEIPRRVVNNELTNRPGIYSVLHNEGSNNSIESPASPTSAGIKTQYHRVDHVNDIFNGNEKLNFNDIRTINNIRNSMYQRPYNQQNIIHNNTYSQSQRV